MEEVTEQPLPSPDEADEAPFISPVRPKRSRSVKNKDPSELEAVEVKIMSQGKEKTFQARRPKKKVSLNDERNEESTPPHGTMRDSAQSPIEKRENEDLPQQGRYYAFHHKMPSARQQAFQAILSSW